MKRTRFWMFAIIAFFSTVNVFAQKVLTVDTEGNPVPYAHIIDENGSIIGTTDLEGTLDGVKFEQTITVSHVAFKEKKAYVKGEGTVRIILEDSDYGLGEIVVKPKDYIYVQTYYRMIYMSDDTMTYCRFGVIDNIYNVKKKTITASHTHISKAEMGLLKTILDGVAGSVIDGKGELPNINSSKKTPLTKERESESRNRYVYNGKIIGYETFDMKDHLRRVSLDEDAYRNILKQEKAEAKAKKGKEPKAEKYPKRNVDDNFYMVYRIDDEGRYGVEDFIMSQWHDDYDKYDKIYKKDEHIRIWLESYSIDREYVDKQELKEKKKANKVKMSWAAIQELESKHNIPSLPAKALEEIKKLFDK